ncbi:MAG: thioredoxin-disulfide reductase [Saprospiraceae bacterium]|nr:thioredoxin-disulfide reductase [Saprospiraceae bacterium]
MEATEKTKCLIIGSGPAGYTAAIYATRAALEPIIYEGYQPGGQLTITTEVENFPGYPKGRQGSDLMTDIREQAENLGTDIKSGLITDVDFSKRPFIAKTDEDKTIEADSIIISTGASARWLGLPSESEYNGYGVSACATCDGFFYKGKDVAVTGGGDTAVEEALYLAKLCKKVYLIHRRDELRASKAMQNKLFNTPNIEVLFNHQVKEIIGVTEGFSKAVTHVLLTKTDTAEEAKIDVEGLFVAIGHKPNTEIFAGKIDLDEHGYIKTLPGTTKTNIEGVFAAGDVQDPLYKQAITAAGSGCMAALDADRFLAEF